MSTLPRRLTFKRCGTCGCDFLATHCHICKTPAPPVLDVDDEGMGADELVAEAGQASAAGVVATAGNGLLPGI